MRADIFLIESGHASTRSQAQRMIAAGVQWRLGAFSPWKRVQKNGDDIPAGAQLQLLDGGQQARYVSRGGLKLEGALATTGLKVKGLRCLDVGQSTGGFTDCLLQSGALAVVGVDVGHGQLHERLRSDARVICVEGVNARAMTASVLQQACEAAISEDVPLQEDNTTQPQAPYAWMRNGGVVDVDYEDAEGRDDATDAQIETFKAERQQRQRDSEAGTLPTRRQRRAGREADDTSAHFDFITGDLSFISLTLVLPALARLLKPRANLLMLVKPQFELQPGQVGKGGIVRDEALFEQVRQRVCDCLGEQGLQVLQWLPSPIEGGDGNREFFVHAVQGEHMPDPEAPLPTAVSTGAARAPRVSRTVLREQKRADVINGDEQDYYNVPGPARPRRKK